VKEIIIWLKIIFWTLCVLIGVTISKAHAEPATVDFMPNTDKKVEQLATAIFHAEGGWNTNYLFGIKSIKCEGYDECRRICKNTIRNNIGRFRVYENAQSVPTNRVVSSQRKNYLQFLQSRYCPLDGDTLTTSEKRLNKHWLKNVMYFLENPVEINVNQ